MSKILDLLLEKACRYEFLSHEEARTCEQSAQARGLPLKLGAKTILVKSKKGYCLMCLRADQFLDLKKVRKILGVPKVRLASEEELYQVAGVPKGALPPLGEPILSLPLYMDEKLLESKLIAFNPGSLKHSVIIEITEYKKLMTPIPCNISVLRTGEN